MTAVTVFAPGVIGPLPAGLDNEASRSGADNVATSLPASVPVPATRLAVPIASFPTLKVTNSAAATLPAVPGEIVALKFTVSLYCCEVGDTDTAVIVAREVIFALVVAIVFRRL